MKTFSKVAAWLIIFVVVLLFRFPYRTVFINFAAKLHQQTGIQLAWEELDVGLLGAHLDKMRLTTPGGSRFAADKAVFTPSWSGFSANFNQTGFEDAEEVTAENAAPSEDSASNNSKPAPGQATLNLKNGHLTFTADNLLVDTGSADLKKVRLTGTLTFDPLAKAGKGELTIKVPQISGLLPIPLKNLEIGTKVAMAPAAASEKNSPTSTPAANDSAKTASGSRITNKLTLFGQGLTGNGEATLTTSPSGASPALEGTLTVKTTSFGTHTIAIGGTWEKPTWNLAGAK